MGIGRAPTGRPSLTAMRGRPALGYAAVQVVSFLVLGLRVAAAPPMPRQDLVLLGDVLKHRKSAALPVELQGPEGARHATLRFNSIGICD